MELVNGKVYSLRSEDKKKKLYIKSAVVRKQLPLGVPGYFYP